MTPKQKFMAFCAERGIAVEHKRNKNFRHHVTAHLKGVPCSSALLWDDDRAAPDWKACLLTVSTSPALRPRSTP